MGDGDDKNSKDSTLSINDINNDCQIVLFKKQGITAANTPGRAGVAMAKAAMGTGVSILTGIRDGDGKHIFGIDITRKNEEKIELFPDNDEVLNIAFYIKNSLSSGLLPELTATLEGEDDGQGKKRDISSERFTSSSMGADSNSEMDIADASRWELAKNTVMDDLIWIESQFTIYDLIKSPMVPLSLIPMYEAGGRAVHTDADRLMRDWEGP